MRNVAIKPAELIASLLADFGTASGLERVAREIGNLSERLAGGCERLSARDLSECVKSLEKLGGTISALDHVVRDRIAALTTDV